MAAEESGGVKSLGLLLLIVGCVTVLVGLVLLVVPRIPWLPPSAGKPDYGVTWGHLPGDIYFRDKNTEFYFPVVTGIVISIVLTIVMNVALRLFRR